MRPWIRWTCLLAALLVAGSALAHAQRVRATAPRHRPVRGRSAGQQPEHAERNWRSPRAGGRCWARSPAAAGAAQRPASAMKLRKRAQDYVTGYDYRQDEGVSANRRADLQHHAGGAFRPGEGAGNGQRPGPAGVARNRGPSWCCGSPSTTAAARAWSGWPRSTRRVPSSTAPRPAVTRRPAGRERRRTGRRRRDLARRHRRHRGAHLVRYSPPMQLIGKLSTRARGWATGSFVDRRARAIALERRRHADARRVMAGGATAPRTRW